MRKAKGLIFMALFLGLCFVSMLGFDAVFRLIAQAAGWRSATSTSTAWSASGEAASFVAQDGRVYRIILPAGKYSSYVSSSKKTKSFTTRAIHRPSSCRMKNE